jgi:hypothetical protein
MKRFLKQLLAAALLMLPAFSYGNGQTTTRAFLSPNTFYYDFHVISGVGPTEYLDLRSIIPAIHTISAKVTGTPTVCDFVVEGSSDGTIWYGISASHACLANYMFHIADKPVRFLRIRLIDLTGTATIAFQWNGVKS